MAEALEMDARIVDQLMPDLVGHDRHPSAFVVFLYLWRRTRTRGVALHRMSLREIAEGTGLSRRGVQNAIRRLERRKLISVEKPSLTAIPRYQVVWP